MPNQTESTVASALNARVWVTCRIYPLAVARGVVGRQVPFGCGRGRHGLADGFARAILPSAAIKVRSVSGTHSTSHRIVA